MKKFIYLMGYDTLYGGLPLAIVFMEKVRQAVVDSGEKDVVLSLIPGVVTVSCHPKIQRQMAHIRIEVEKGQLHSALTIVESMRKAGIKADIPISESTRVITEEQMLGGS